MLFMKVNGVCKEPNPCSGGFDLGILVQSSKRATEKDFEREKNAISEMIGRLNVGLDKVHVGYLYYSHRTRRTATLTRKEQSNKKTYFIERAQKLPYIPFYTTPLGYALAQSSEQIFNSRRDTYVPRVAVLFNEGSSTEDLSYITNQANNLKSQGVEIFAVSIGNESNDQQLRSIVSSPSNLIKVDSHEFIFEKLTEITHKICSVNIPVYLDRVENILTGKYDYRYFKLDLTGLRSDIIQIEIEEKTGYSVVFHSFEEKNPTFENSKSFYKKSSMKSEKVITDSYITIVPPGATTLYFTIEGIGEINELNLLAQNIIF